VTSTVENFCGLPVPKVLLAPAIEHLVPCCDGFAIFGPDRCTCWEDVYEPISAAPDIESSATVMPRMCGDCAFRRDSPERRGEPSSAAHWEDLQHLVESETPFWCHDGMPKIAGWRHPSGVWVPAPTTVDSYRPTVVDGIPYRADGRTGSHCAGWAAAVDRKRVRTARAARTLQGSVSGADDTTVLARLLARRPDLRGVGISEVLEARWSA
jgi:hypothetical protein